MKATLSIGRPTYGDGEEKISIEVRDEKSRIQFLELEINLDDFAKCLTGMSCCPADMQVRNLRAVGKVKETTTKKLLMSGCSKDAAKKLAVANCPEGWKTDMYFGSKSSIIFEGGEYFANAKYYRYVEDSK